MSDAFAHLDPRRDATTTWRVERVDLPSLRRACPKCTTNVSTATGRFRVNANGRRLDVWLLIRCAQCGHNARVKVHHRTNVASFPPGKLRGYVDNDPDLLTTALLDPLTARHGHYTLDWTNAWKLTTPDPEPSRDRRTIVRVHFEVPVPIRPVRIIALGLTLRMGEVERLIADGRITSEVRLSRKTSSSFDFAVTPDSR